MSIGLFGRYWIAADPNLDQLRKPSGGLIELYVPDYGFVGLHCDSDGKLAYTPSPDSNQPGDEHRGAHHAAPSLTIDGED